MRRGETLATIAREEGVSIDDLRQMNGLTTDAVVYPGDTLELLQN